ncbi:hypothetical protein TBS_29100 [Thermobispora bispora]|jgi:AcrR family transcriptional regulator|uniref:Transcriptional regulator, TetR family n=1 Tax=Thermobispora bispora (strain ATCC 19993 / DSM 43833 / CBS 139.67 / JCM 10125 / KCTC 9307 / NBRC 14880 / R51) TaxID=469371 RepID=D6Y6S7_THEBD|nr:TetR family transcriptional regulator [Thermobispora bispora]ADG89568.1 transcriptional regulator, TetR family [Thermobispora bispora DSM 43833]MBO2474745.1 helix-turn-helix domain-containing protein [Actinomycetales bacterium]MDI9580666.1 TetR family transcriptional regulator [Thermobispora sp.]QSI49191.1 TetR family transcriptional regulator [Thermobispora bispora]
MSAMEERGRIGRAIRRARRDRGISLRELARLVGVSPGTISAIENGKTGITIARLSRIASALGVPPAALLEEPPPERAAGPPPGAGEPGEWRHFAPLPIDGVLAAAIRSFVATGYHGASMRDIAQQANMSVPGVYHHYLNKQELLVRILDIAMQDLIWRVERARDEGTGPLERIALVVEALALFHTRRSDLAFIGASEMRSLEPENRRKIAAMRDHVQHVLDRLIDEAVAEGRVEAEDARMAGKAIATMCTSLPSWFRIGGPMTPEEIAKQYARFALGLLGAKTGG